MSNLTNDEVSGQDSLQSTINDGDINPEPKKTTTPTTITADKALCRVVLANVYLYLTDIDDITNFSLVCKKWNSVHNSTYSQDKWRHYHRYTGPESTEYANGKTKYYKKWLNGRPYGNQFYYFPNGQLCYRENYDQHGMLTQISKKYYLNGQEMEMIEWSEGRQHGIYRLRSHTGTIIRHQRWADGNLIETMVDDE
jgi:hypothetical protein